MDTVIGVDPSLARTAVATIADGNRVGVEDFPTKGAKSDNLAQRAARLDKISGQIFNLVDRKAPALIVIEGPSHGQTNGSHHDRSGLWWILMWEWFHEKIPVVEIPPASVKMYATGKGNAGKDEVLLSTARRYGHLVHLENNDQADALILAAIGWHHLAPKPVAPIPQTHLRALGKVRWPDPLDPAGPTPTTWSASYPLQKAHTEQERP